MKLSVRTINVKPRGFFKGNLDTKMWRIVHSEEVTEHDFLADYDTQIFLLYSGMVLVCDREQKRSMWRCAWNRNQRGSW